MGRGAVLGWLIFCLSLICVQTLSAQNFADEFYSDPLAAFEGVREAWKNERSLEGCLHDIRRMSEVIPEIRLTRLNDMKWLNFGSVALKENPRYWMPKLADSVWNLQLILRGRLQEAYREGILDEQTLADAREINRLLGFVRDYTGVFLGYDPYVPVDRHRPNFFSGSENLKGFDFKAGDIILTRGPTATSGLIGRLAEGKNDGPFSHVVFITKGPGGKLFPIEALIETGVHAITMEELVGRQSARGAILRHPDRKLAERAARLLFDRWLHGKYMKYDFTGLGPSDSSESFQCVHVPQWAYLEAYESLNIKDHPSIPLFPSQMDRMAPIGSQLGFNPSLPYFFAPTDYWYQLDFELVGEWSIPASLEDVMLFDVTADRLFDWSRNEGLAISPRLRDSAKARVAVTLALFWDVLPKVLKKKVPRDMPYDSIKVANALIAVVNKLKEELRAASDEFLRENDGVPMGWLEAQEALDRVRERLEEDPDSIIRLLQEVDD